MIVRRAGIALGVFVIGCAAPQANCPALPQPSAAPAPAPAPAQTARAEGRAEVTLESDEEKTLYALGEMLAKNLAVFGLTARELEIVQAGMADKIIRRSERVALGTWGEKVNTLAHARQRARAADEEVRGRAYREQAARRAGARTLPSGVIVETEVPGTGASPASSADRVKVRYEGRLVDGTVFDSSVARNQDATFPLAGVIKCWTEAVGQMKLGEKALLVCPPETAYGDEGRPPSIPGGATLIFEVELLDVTPP